MHCVTRCRIRNVSEMGSFARRHEFQLMLMAARTMEFLCKSGFALKEHPATQWNNARGEEGFTRQQSSSRLQCSANMVVEAGKVTGWVSNLHSWDPEQKGCHVTRPFLKQGSCFVFSISIVKYFCSALEIRRKKYQMRLGYSKKNKSCAVC